MVNLYFQKNIVRYLTVIFIACFFKGHSQNKLSAEKTSSKKINTEELISIDNLGAFYTIKNNVFSKENDREILEYNNVQLGTIQTVNTFNPLKINLFYKDFNTVIILDNRLSEIYKIDFNTSFDFKDVSHVSTGFNNTLWIFNQNLQQLELFDYMKEKVSFQCIPVSSQVLDLKSNYNTCWLLTKNNIFTYNYFGSLLNKIPNSGFTKLEVLNNGVILEKNNKLYFLNTNSTEVYPIELPNILINSFFVTNETLYIYSNETLYEFQIKYL